MPLVGALSILTKLGVPGEQVVATVGAAAPLNVPDSWPYPPYIEALDSWYAAIENLTAEGDANSINIPWLLQLSVSVGNATTTAISKNCVVFTEMEWGEATGLGKAGMIGGGSGEGGGVYASW
jgi:hypothetical protein